MDMRKILYILIALVATMVASCKTTTKVVTMHDTLTIERAVVQEVTRHDTAYLHDTTNMEIERVIYDTLERIKEVQRVVYRNGKVEAHSEAEKVVVRDTVYISQGSKTDVKETKPHAWGNFVLWSVLGIIIVGIIAFVIYRIK